MDHIDLLILKNLSEERNITKTAERMFISQPALTRRLKNMEREIKATLVLRIPNGVVLTPQGEEFLRYAERTLLQFKKFKEHIQGMNENILGSLSLGVSSVFAHYELPQLLKHFLELYPDVEFSLKTGHSIKINRMLQKDEVSLAILRGDFHWDEKKHLLYEDPICLVSSKSLKLQDLTKNRRIVAKSAIQTQIDEWWHQTFSCPPATTIEVDSLDTCRQMVLNGLGWSIMPKIGLKSYDNLYTQNLYLANGTPLVRRTWLVYRSIYLELPSVRAFVEFTQKHFKNHPPK